MKYYMSEGEAIYQDKNHGLFSRKLAEWAIDNMEVKDASTKEVKKLKEHSIEEMDSVLKQYKVELPEEFVYTAWYLYNMTFADYPKTIKTDEQRAMYIDETICDVDGSPENVLNCFVAKMCQAEQPIFWENYL
jgi:hypothetical protein